MTLREKSIDSYMKDLNSCKMLLLFLLFVVAHACVIDPQTINGYTSRSYGCHHVLDQQFLVGPAETPSTPQECANLCTQDTTCKSFTWDYVCSDTCSNYPYYNCYTAIQPRCYHFSSDTCNTDPGEYTVVYNKRGGTIDNPRVVPSRPPDMFSQYTEGTNKYFECVGADVTNAKTLAPNSVDRCAIECLNNKNTCNGFMFDVLNRDYVPYTSGGSVDYKSGKRCLLFNTCSSNVTNTRTFLYVLNTTLASAYCTSGYDCLSGQCSNGYCTEPRFVDAVKLSIENEKCNSLDSNTLFTCSQGKYVCNEWTSSCVKFGKNPGEICTNDNECLGISTCNNNDKGTKTCGGQSLSKNNVFNLFY